MSRLRPKCSGSGQNVPAPALAPQHWLAGNVLLGEDEGQVFLPEAGQRGRHHAAAHHHHKLLNLIIIYKQLVYGTYNVINLNLLCVICIQKIIEEGQLLRYKENGQNFSQVPTVVNFPPYYSRSVTVPVSRSEFFLSTFFYSGNDFFFKKK